MFTLHLEQFTYGHHNPVVGLGPCNFQVTKFVFQAVIRDEKGMVHHVVEVDSRKRIPWLKRWVREQFGLSFRGVTVHKSVPSSYPKN